jgi:hypothetical protein
MMIKTFSLLPFTSNLLLSYIPGKQVNNVNGSINGYRCVTIAGKDNSARETDSPPVAGCAGYGGGTGAGYDCFCKFINGII